MLLTGATGFLGQALLERLLSSFPDTRVTLLIRSRGSSSPADRLEKLLRRPVFHRWREQAGEAAVKAAVAERVQVCSADLGTAGLSLPADLTAVIHSASTVAFDPPIDEAFRTNVQGVVDLYQAVRDNPGRPHVVHISTAYVAGARRGSVPEESLDHDVDWRTELAAARAARPAVEQESRRPEVLRRALAAPGASTARPARSRPPGRPNSGGWSGYGDSWSRTADSGRRPWAGRTSTP